MESKPTIEGLAHASGPGTGLALPAHISLPFDIKTGTMTMFLLTEDRLDSVHAGSDTLDSTFFGASLGIFLFIAGILVSSKIANSAIADWLRIPLWTGFIPSLILSIYFGVKAYRCRSAAHRRLAEIKNKSATVVALQPK